MRRAALCLCMALAGAFAHAADAPAAAEQAVTRSIQNLLGDPGAYIAVIRQVQAAVAAGDAQALSALVSYPISVTVDGRKQTLKDTKAFVAAYPRIMTPAIATAVREQRYQDLFVNAQGVMFGRGELWINGICEDKACTRSVPRVVTIQHVP